MVKGSGNFELNAGRTQFTDMFQYSFNLNFYSRELSYHCIDKLGRNIKTLIENKKNCNLKLTWINDLSKLLFPEIFYLKLNKAIPKTAIQVWQLP